MIKNKLKKINIKKKKKKNFFNNPQKKNMKKIK